jgi:hypothetical protein
VISNHQALPPNSAHELDNRVVLVNSLFNLQRHSCSPVQWAGRSKVFEFLEIAGDHSAVFWEIAEFSAGNL